MSGDDKALSEEVSRQGRGLAALSKEVSKQGKGLNELSEQVGGQWKGLDKLSNQLGDLKGGLTDLMKKLEAQGAKEIAKTADHEIEKSPVESKGLEMLTKEVHGQ